MAMAPVKTLATTFGLVTDARVIICPVLNYHPIITRASIMVNVYIIMGVVRIRVSHRWVVFSVYVHRDIVCLRMIKLVKVCKLECYKFVL